MNKLTLPIALILLAGAGHAQLLPDQKLLDFQQLAALYAKQYAPYEWKRDRLGFDLLRLAPWLDRVRATKNDIEFYEVSAEYVASLNDAHSQIFLPSDFYAYLGFEVDLYDGKALVEFIDAPTSRAVPFRIGDELISIDGRTVAEWLKEFAKYMVFANSRSTDRSNASWITYRIQTYYPRAPEVGEEATVVVRRRTTGAVETYTLPWVKGGLPLSTIGPVPSPRLASVPKARAAVAEDGDGAPAPIPSYLKPLRDLQTFRIPEGKNLRGYGEIVPIFRPALPSTFVQRLGRGASDFFYSGVYPASGKRIGFIRIPEFLLYDGGQAGAFAVRQFETEIAFLQANTDALVVDIMRNPGGISCYAEDLLRRIVPYRFRGMGIEVRVTRDWLISVHQAIEDAEFFGADQTAIDQLKAVQTELELAYKRNRGHTNAIPACATYFERDPPTTPTGASLAYTKPVMLLTDEFSSSAAEIFAAIFQDSHRGPVFGWRTTGAGGSISGPIATGFYSESLATVTQTMALRTEHVMSPEYGITPYIENSGVLPDITVDYMTEENLLTQGKAFVDAFTAAIVNIIR